MNRQRILDFAEFIEELPHQPNAGDLNETEEAPNVRLFNMDVFRVDTECGTVCGMAGWIGHFLPEQFTDYDRLTPTVSDLAHGLEITYLEAEHLAMGRWQNGPLNNITPAQAAAALREFAV